MFQNTPGQYARLNICTYVPHAKSLFRNGTFAFFRCRSLKKKGLTDCESSSDKEGFGRGQNISNVLKTRSNTTWKMSLNGLLYGHIVAYRFGKNASIRLAP